MNNYNKYISIKDEYQKYVTYLKSKRFTQSIFYSDIRHYRSFFSNKFNFIEEVFLYAQKAMSNEFPDYIGQIVDQRIRWTKLE